MKLALISPLPPEKNGIANYADFFRIALQENDIDLITPLKGEANFNSIEDATDFVEKHDWSKIDLVHAELGGGRLREYAIIKELQRLYPNLAITATVHDPERLIWRAAKLPWPFELLKGVAQLYKVAILLFDPLTLRDERRTARKLAQIITLTDTGARSLEKRMRLESNSIRVIPHGNSVIPVKELPPLKPLKLLYFGFIYKGKGIEDLIDALKLVIDTKPELRESVTLTLAGGCSPEIAFGQKTNYLSELKSQVKRLGLDDIVEWELDIPEGNISSLIQQHHVVVLPYQESKKLKLLGNMRGTSGALSWAIACGRGVITSDARSFSEEVKFGNGVVYPQGNIPALADEIITIAQQPEITALWAQQAQKIALERVWTKTAEKFQRLFSHVIMKGVK